MRANRINGNGHPSRLLWQEPSPEATPPPATSTKRNRSGLPLFTSHERYPKAFEAFWSVYPRKQAKGAARESFAKAIARLLDGGSFSDWVGAAKFLCMKAREFATAKQGEPFKYIPHPTTWLNQERYEDDAATWSDGEVGDRGEDARDIPPEEAVFNPTTGEIVRRRR